MQVQHKRMTIADNCMGCFACEVACKQEHNLPVGPRWIWVSPDMREIDGKLRLNYFVTECTHVAPAPCQLACPAGMNAWYYVTLISQGKFKEALEVIRETTPLAGVLGRVCTHPCETECERGGVDALVAICSLKRFVADYEMRAGREKATPVKKTKEAKVAIIGSGPAGLSCAYDLVRQGYPVTVFEAESQPGGLLRYGIPEYRLPKEVVDNEISYIEELGVAIKTNTPVGNLEDIFNQEYKAIFLSIGCQESMKLGIPDEDTKGVIYALNFLKQVNSGGKVSLGDRVAVIGGGSAAIDAARVSLRLGAKEVHLVCLETRDLTSKDRMLAQNREIEEAEEEGLIIHPCLGPKEVLTREGRIVGLETIVCTSVRDEYGRFAPKFTEGSAPTIEADTIIVAIGQTPEEAIFKEVEKGPTETIKVNSITLQTNIDGVFAGGDVVAGAGDVIAAIAAGKEAAISIDRYLRGVDLREGRAIAVKVSPRVPREDTKKRVVTIADKEAAIAEAKCCLNCGECAEAIERGLQPACVSACPSHCIYYRDIWEVTPKTGTYSVV